MALGEGQLLQRDQLKLKQVEQSLCNVHQVEERQVFETKDRDKKAVMWKTNKQT